MNKWFSNYTPVNYSPLYYWFEDASAFPAQFAGLRVYYGGSVKELCLVAVADAPAGQGGSPRVVKNGVPYALYLLDIADPLASNVRMQTSTGIKSVRLKT